MDDAFYSISSDECISIKYLDVNTIVYFYSSHKPDSSCANGCPLIMEKKDFINPSVMMMPIDAQYTTGHEEGSITGYWIEGPTEDPNSKKIYFADFFQNAGLFRKPYKHLESKEIDSNLLWIQDGPNEWHHCNIWAGGCGYSSNPASWTEQFAIQRGIKKGYLTIENDESFDSIKSKILMLVSNE